MVKVRIDGIGENDAYIEVEATRYGLELGVGYEDSERRSLVTSITRDELTAVAKAFEAVVLVTDEDDFEAKD